MLEGCHERVVALRLPATAEDDVLPPSGERPERAEGRGGVRRLRVVHVEHAVDGCDLLDAMLDAEERLESPADRVVVDADRAGGGSGGRGVLAVVGTADPRLGRERVVAGELDPARVAG